MIGISFMKNRDETSVNEHGKQISENAQKRMVDRRTGHQETEKEI